MFRRTAAAVHLGAAHAPLARTHPQPREFVVNIPTPEQRALTDYVGVVTGREEGKFAITDLRLTPAHVVKTPLVADCSVNIECQVEQEVSLDSHTLFIGRVVAVHADENLLDERGEVDFALARGLAYNWAVVRERPTY